MRQEDLHEAFRAHLESFQVPEIILDAFAYTMKEVWTERRKDLTGRKIQIGNELNTIQKRKDRLNELIVKGTIDDETYAEQMHQVRSEIAVKQIEQNEAQDDKNDFESCLEYSLYFISHLGKMWFNSELEAKREVQRFMFPDGISWTQGDSFRTPRIPLIFQYLDAVKTTPKGRSVPTLSYFEQPNYNFGNAWPAIQRELSQVAELMKAA